MVVFFDIDGTVVDNDTQIIPESTVRAVEALGRNGHIAVVNTGRPYSHIDPRVRRLAFQGWICGCGMDVRMGGEVFQHLEPDDALCRFVVEKCGEFGMDPLLESDDGSIVLTHMDHLHPTVAREAEQMRSKGFQVYPYSEHPHFMKLVTFDTPGCRRAEFLTAMEPYFTCIDRGNTMLELVIKGCSKANGMNLLLSRLGVPQQDTLAIGDSTNDLPMFSVAAHTVCMGGGMEELKREAEYITAPVLDDGIEKALKHYGLI